MHKRRRNNHGFSLLELIMVLMLIAVISSIALNKFGDASGAARDKAKIANAKNINHMIATIHSVGGSVGDGTTNDVDTTSMTTVVDSLTKQPPIDVDGFAFALDNKPNPAAYRLALQSGAPHKTVEAILGTKDKP